MEVVREAACDLLSRMNVSSRAASNVTRRKRKTAWMIQKKRGLENENCAVVPEFEVFFRRGDSEKPTIMRMINSDLVGRLVFLNVSAEFVGRRKK